MSSDNPIVIPIPFHGDTITAIETADAQMVAVRPICERLGIDWSGQLKRLKAEKRWRGGAISTPSAGGMQETYCIPRSKLFGWLASISANRVKPEVRDRLALYQDEADEVLDRHFRLRAAETSARIEELERMLWHSHQQLRIDNPKWGQAFLMMERGDSTYMIAKRNKWTMDEAQSYTGQMRRCGMSPTWREDMGTLMDQNSDLRWRLDRARRATEQNQPSLFDGAADV